MGAEELRYHLMRVPAAGTMQAHGRWRGPWVVS